MFAIFDLGIANLSQFLMNCLAVVGGFLVAYMLTGLAGTMLDRWSTGGQSPAWMHKWSRRIGGVIGAILVALLVFGKGGGSGGGRGEGEGDGVLPGKAVGSGGTIPSSPSTSKSIPPVVPPDPLPNVDYLKVTILGGDEVREQRFYQIDASSPALTYPELRDKLAARKLALVGKMVGLEVRLSERNRLPDDHAAVLRVRQLAQEEGVVLTFPGQP